MSIPGDLAFLALQQRIHFLCSTYSKDRHWPELRDVIREDVMPEVRGIGNREGYESFRILHQPERPQVRDFRACFSCYIQY